VQGFYIHHPGKQHDGARAGVTPLPPAPVAKAGQS